MIYVCVGCPGMIEHLSSKREENPSVPKKSATLRSLISAYLDEQCTVLIEAEPALRGREPVIHSTRVAARRLRSTLRTYPETADHDRAEALTTELVWFAGLLGDVRDREVLEERLLTDLATLPPELVIGPVAPRSRPS